MTFDTLEFLDPPVTTCSERGITVMGGPAEDQFRKPAPNFMDQDIDLVDSEADAPWVLTFSLSTTAQFAAILFDMSSRHRLGQLCDFVGTNLTCSAAFRDLLVQGYRNAAVVADSWSLLRFLVVSGS